MIESKAVQRGIQPALASGERGLGCQRLPVRLPESGGRTLLDDDTIPSMVRHT